MKKLIKERKKDFLHKKRFLLNNKKEKLNILKN